MTETSHRAPPSRRWLAVIAITVLVVSIGVYIASRGEDPHGTTQEASDAIPNCVVGTLKSVGHATPPIAGTPEWERVTFSSPVAAAQDVFDRYVAAGRVDGRSVGQVGLGMIDMETFFVPTSGSPEQGEAVFKVEQVGDRYAVLYWEFCQGAEPTESLFPEEQ